MLLKLSSIDNVMVILLSHILKFTERYLKLIYSKGHKISYVSFKNSLKNIEHVFFTNRKLILIADLLFYARFI